MIIDRVLYFGARDSSDARDSVFRFRNTAGATRGFVGCVGCEDCRFKADGEAFGFDLGGDGDVAVAARGAVEEGRGAVGKPVWINCGDSKGFI
jgi:hypothetical protein